MTSPRVSRPVFPDGYVEHAKTFLAWEEVEQRLVEALHYWLCTVRPNGQPHAVPRWGVWVEGRLYYDGSPETRHARNLGANPQVTVHLESGEQALILEGEAAPAGAPQPEMAQKLAAEYGRKYAALGYAPQPDQWDAGGLFVFAPRKVLAWTRFMDDPTRFEF